VIKLVKLTDRELKLKYVETLGSKCQNCGYNKCLSALEFHIDKKYKPRKKNRKFWNRDSEFRQPYFKRVLKEGKVKLLCANCHRELECKRTKHDFQMSILDFRCRA